MEYNLELALMCYSFYERGGIYGYYTKCNWNE